MIPLDVLIECRSCSMIASEAEFGEPGAILICPRCRESSNLWDYEEA